MSRLYLAASVAAMIAYPSVLYSLSSSPEPEPVERPMRLIGFGCEPGAKTLLASEEDEFPGKCRDIESIETACAVTWEENGETYSTILPGEECRDFWGDGY